MGDIFSDIAGALTGGVTNLIGQQMTNDANSAQAQKMMDFEKEMRKTQYQTEVTDLNKAGLNPALAYHGGAGTPGGAMSSQGNVLGAGITGAQSGLALAQQAADLNVKGSQVANIDADTVKKAAEAKNIGQATSASKTKQSLDTPKSMELDVITDMYKNHPTLKKLKAYYDYLTGGLEDSTSTAKGLADTTSAVMGAAEMIP